MAVAIDPVAVEEEAARLEIAAIARFLQETLGQQLTAYIAGLRDPKMVGRWASGKVEPRDLAKAKLRTAFQAARMIVEAYGVETARAWFVGSNTRLDDEAPAWVLRYADGIDGLRFVVPTARAFAGAGD
jgi:hypothetical protein